MKSIIAKPKRKSDIITPKELIEMHELVALELQDRRIYRLLVKNAWEKIDTDTMHSIPKKLLRQGMGGAKQRLGQSIERLMGVIIRRHVGNNGVERFQLLAHNIEADQDNDDTSLRYSFPAPLRDIIRTSEVWARLESHVIYAFSSKYALALYELVSLRCNLKHKTAETFSFDAFRALIGVEKEKLPKYAQLKQSAIDKALTEVNALCPDFSVNIEPELTGRKVTAIKVSWWPKDSAAQAAALKELGVSKIGREARISGKTEKVFIEPKVVRLSSRRGLTTEDIGKLREEFGGFAFEEIYNGKFRDFIASTGGDPDNIKNAYLRFSGYLRGKNSPIKRMKA